MPERRRATRLSWKNRHRQLLDAALALVREEGADRLTLGRLAESAGVSKPVVYDHFGTRPTLLIEMYKDLDARQSDALRSVLTTGRRSKLEAAQILAAAYVRCSVDAGGDYSRIGAALAGSEEMAAVHQELLDGYVRLFATVLQPHSDVSHPELHRRCIGLIGAGEALSGATIRGEVDEAQSAEALSILIVGALRTRA